MIILLPLGLGLSLWVAFSLLARWLKPCQHVLNPGDTVCMRCHRDIG